MAITLNSADLPGINIRQVIGDYEIDTGGFIEEQQGEGGGFLGFLWNLTKGVGGFIWKAAGGIFSAFSFTFTNLWTLLVRQTQFLINFNFGATDEQLDAQIKGQWDAVAGQYGGLLGQTLGWLVCGVAPAAGIFLFNEALGVSLLREVGDEALDEVSASLYVLINTITQNYTRSLFIRAFKARRRWLRKPGNPLYQYLPDSLKQAWQTGKSWTIAQAIEEKIESINDPAIENFLEELLEEFGDSCIEPGYVIAGGLDRYVAEQRRRSADQLIEVTPNREYPNEKFILYGGQDELRDTLPQVLTHYEILDQRDVGVVSAIESSQLYTQAMPLELYCKIEWRSSLGNAGPRPAYQVSSVKRSKIGDYAFIRQIAGGANGYLWGRWKAVASMNDGHFITCYGGNEGEAEERVLALATLSDAEVQIVNVTEEKRSATRLTIQGLRKETTQVFPYRIVVTNRKYFSQPQPGSKASKRGYYVPLSARLRIDSTQKPMDWDERIAEILAGPTASNPG